MAEVRKCLRDHPGVMLSQPISKNRIRDADDQVLSPLVDEGGRPEPCVKTVFIDFELDAPQHIVPKRGVGHNRLDQLEWRGSLETLVRKTFALAVLSLCTFFTIKTQELGRNGAS